MIDEDLKEQHADAQEEQPKKVKQQRARQQPAQPLPTRKRSAPRRRSAPPSRNSSNALVQQAHLPTMPFHPPTYATPIQAVATAPPPGAGLLPTADSGGLPFHQQQLLPGSLLMNSFSTYLHSQMQQQQQQLQQQLASASGLGGPFFSAQPGKFPHELYRHQQAPHMQPIPLGVLSALPQQPIFNHAMFMNPQQLSALQKATAALNFPVAQHPQTDPNQPPQTKQRPAPRQVSPVQSELQPMSTLQTAAVLPSAALQPFFSGFSVSPSNLTQAASRAAAEPRQTPASSSTTPLHAPVPLRNSPAQKVPIVTAQTEEQTSGQRSPSGTRPTKDTSLSPPKPPAKPVPKHASPPSSAQLSESPVDGQVATKSQIEEPRKDAVSPPASPKKKKKKKKNSSDAKTPPEEQESPPRSPVEPQKRADKKSDKSAGKSSDTSDSKALQLALRPQYARSDVSIVKDGARLWICPHCKKEYRSKSGWIAHLRTHSGIRPFECNFCGLRFNQKGHLTRHRRTHTGERPYGCKVCGKRFNRNGTLTAHMRTHTGEKPFKCMICGKRLKQKCAYSKHIKLHENASGGSSSMTTRSASKADSEDAGNAKSEQEKLEEATADENNQDDDDDEEGTAEDEAMDEEDDEEEDEEEDDGEDEDFDDAQIRPRNKRLKR